MMSSATGEAVLAALAAYKLEQEGAGRWRCNSPFRVGANSHSFSVTINPDMEHGAYKDFVSGESGSLYDLAEHLNIPVTRQTVADTKRGYSGLADYAKAHGVEEAVYAAAGWKECEGIDRDGRKRPALSIPTASGLRYRFLDGDKPPYHSPGGFKRCWYGLRRAVDLARQDNKPLVFCNGEASVVVAQHYGIPAVAVAGGAEQIPDTLLLELRQAWQGNMLIAMDCDPQGKTATGKYSDQLPTARIVDLGLSHNGDLADFAALYQGDALDELSKRAVKLEQFREVNDMAALAQTLKALEQARKADGKTDELPALIARAESEIGHLKQRTQPIRTMSFEELVDANHKALLERRKTSGVLPGLHTHLPRLDKLVGGWVGGREYVLLGDTGMGKSTLCISITLQWTKQGSGLIVSTELPPRAYMNKVAAAWARVPYDRIDEGTLSDAEFARVEAAYAELETLKCDVLDAGSPSPQDVEAALKRGMNERGYKWCVIDSISKMKYPGETDIYNTTRLVADAMQDLCRELNIPFLMTAQVGRNLKDRAVKLPQLNDGLGAGTIEQNADYVFSVYRHEQYVKLGVVSADPKFPPGMALVTCLKDRWRGKTGDTVPLTYIGGAGYYEMATDEPQTPPVQTRIPGTEAPKPLKNNQYLKEDW